MILLEWATCLMKSALFFFFSTVEFHHEYKHFYIGCVFLAKYFPTES